MTAREARRRPASWFVEGVRGGDRTILAQALTLVESRRDDDVRLAQEILRELLPTTGDAMRVGITGVPGVGKSTLIETLGMRLVAAGRRPGVLAVDPSSSRTGGSILGDKSRMTELARDERAFIRPSPAGEHLGGVARRTRESMLVCEAAGYDPILVETVGVGQSEAAVHGMVDTFVVLALPGAGDELQGIKKGVFELADLIVVNKADGDNLARAREAVRDLSAALRCLPRESGDVGAADGPKPEDERGGEGDGDAGVGRPLVLAVSAKTGDGLDAMWEAILEHRRALERTGALEARRREQRRRWMWSLVDESLRDDFRRHPAVRERLGEIERELDRGELPSTEAALRLLDAYRGASRG